MKVVVLTNPGSLFGKKILNNLMSYGIKIEAAVVVVQPLKYYGRLFKYVQKQVGTFDALYFSMKRFLDRARKKKPVFLNNKCFMGSYKEMGMPILYTKATNSERTSDILRSIAPDLLILGQTGIVTERLLKTPKIGTLNAHPGILPYYRGIDCAKWAIYNGEFHRVGSSVHWVNSRVDAGNIIVKQVYNFSGNETFEMLEENLYDLCISLLTEVVKSVFEGNIPSGESQNRNQGKQYFKMPRKTEKIARKELGKFLYKESLTVKEIKKVR